MVRRASLITVSSLGFALRAAAGTSGAVVGFCPGDKCQECPVQLTSQGTGYPDCTVYDSNQVFGDEFEGAESGGFHAFMDISEPDEGCTFILTTPADAGHQKCGKPFGTFSHAACASVTVDKTFMVQYCCGDSCKGAGTGNTRRAIGPNKQTLTVNGTVVKPVQVGNPPEVRSRVFAHRSPEIFERADGGGCDNNWKYDNENEKYYTVESDSRQVMSNSVESGSMDISETREVSYTESYTQGAEMGLNFGDILSLGVSGSTTEGWSETTSDSTTYHFDSEEGQTGNVVFTPYLNCTTGSGTCKGKSVAGTFCTGYKQHDQAAGIWSFVIHN